jgi:low temperature requirement protein LtrA
VVGALGGLSSLARGGGGRAPPRDRFILWGYGHYGIFAALAALGAGLKVAVEQNAHPFAVSPVVAGYAVAVPVGVFLVLVWAVHMPLVMRLAVRPAVMLGGAGLILLLPLAGTVTGLAFVVTSIAVVCALMIAATIALRGGGRRGTSQAARLTPLTAEPLPAE